MLLGPSEKELQIRLCARDIPLLNRLIKSFFALFFSDVYYPRNINRARKDKILAILDICLKKQNIIFINVRNFDV